MPVKVSIHFGITNLVASAFTPSFTPYVLAQNKPTVTVRVDGGVDADGKPVVMYFFAYMDCNNNDRIEFNQFMEEPSLQNQNFPVRFYGFDESDDFEAKALDFPVIKRFFERNLDCVVGKENKDHLRYVLTYLALVKHINLNGIAARYFPEWQDYLKEMRTTIIAAYNSAQVDVHESGGDFFNPIRFYGCSVPMPEEKISQGQYELERILQFYSNGEASHFKGNIVSLEYGIVYSCHDGKVFGATRYPQSTWDAEKLPIHEGNGWREKILNDLYDLMPNYEENEGGKHPVEAFVKDAPVGNFQNGKPYKILEVIERMGISYVKMEDENKNVVCLRKDRLEVNSTK